MSDESKPRLHICRSDELVEGHYRRIDVILGKRAVVPLVVLRYQGQCRAYRNRCVHQALPLDCDTYELFDDSGRLLRCSTHGVTYEPLSGVVVSPLCEGMKLTAFKVLEDADGIWLVDGRVKGLAGATQGDA
ncbi:Rieske (2Fe-2S) protein [Plasticicumulans acidivorans]|uniref:Nitrite reductase/ring-hydroxylating ferredoxin subunit n=1 Tax=Plasticicumulans acidivorans TaxID=886464 RepID=A0A317N160_9GAMM|nr:Rieske 2Fe-2S domain-containing protein [Plasticicumulans acidivorans]PWV65864.1 nitrite reductase/ring-hydroxylating ferredoxin subunit [Plasticicumulans acidivorans]